MAFMRSSDWKDDERLKDSLEEYSRQGLQRQEILSFMKKDFSHYGLVFANIRQKTAVV